MTSRAPALRLAVLASGAGSNLRHLVREGFNVVAVGTNRPACGAAQFAREQGLSLGVFRQRDYGSSAERDLALAAWLTSLRVELVVNAGYDRILAPGFVAQFAGRIINLHPSLLPAFAGGMDAVQRALDARVKVTGCTVHLVTDEVDAGPILIQAAVPVLEGDSVATLHERIHQEEHRILAEAIRLLAQKSPSLSS